MPSERALPTEHGVLDEPAPLWSRIVVGISILATGAAAGIASMQHLDVEPWLAWTIGIGVAVVLAAIDQALQRPLGAPRVESQKSSRRAPKLPKDDVPLSPVSAPATTSPRPAVAKPAAPASLSDATFDQHVQHLQTLVREMAQSTRGPKARTADPDGLSRFEAPPHTAAPRGPAAAKTVPAPATVSAAPVRPAMAHHAAKAASPPTSAPRIAEAVAAERLDVLLESIQSLGDGRARHFEVSVRFRDAAGVDITENELSAAARRTGLAPRIDALKLPRVARVARKVQQRGGQPADVLAGVAGPSLADHGFMEAFAATMTGSAPVSLVLSFSQADVRDFARVHWSALATLSDMGFRFALTDVTDVDMDIDLLRARGFTFVKLDAPVFLEGLPYSNGVIPARDICRHFETAGLALIVSRVDADAQLEAIRRHGVQFAQGGIFGGARKVRADILADAA
jgi:cyclic-di-GMP phosphodiesterase TipF (flagellum assembly factor)